MKRRTFLQVSLATLAALALPNAAHGNTMRKGFHIDLSNLTPQVLAAAATLGADFFEGTDGVCAEMRDAAHHERYAPLALPYLARVPHDISIVQAQNIQQHPNFTNEWVVLNEGDVWNITPAEAAVLATAIITNVTATDPTRENKFWLSAGSQTAGIQYLKDVWQALGPVMRSYVHGISLHYYPNHLNPNLMEDYIAPYAAFCANKQIALAGEEFGFPNAVKRTDIIPVLGDFFDVWESFGTEFLSWYGLLIPPAPNGDYYHPLVKADGTVTSFGNKFANEI